MIPSHVILSLAMTAVSGVVTQVPHDGHWAVDIACPKGAVVHAVFDGETRVHRDGRLGTQVTLVGEHRRALYAHLEAASEPGTVKKGDPIGVCGNTGSWSTGRHLHFELY